MPVRLETAAPWSCVKHSTTEPPLYSKTCVKQPLKIRHYYTSVDGTPSQTPAFDLPKASAKFEVAMSNGLGGDALTRKYIISLSTLTLSQGQTHNIAQYPVHHDLCTCKV